MRIALSALALAAILFSTRSAAQFDDSHRPVYGIGGQYSAVLYQARSTWQLLPANGPDQMIPASHCSQHSHFPTGVWLVAQDADGKPELIAPSTTVLPPGSPDHIPLRACEASGESALVLPQNLLDQLIVNVGAVYIDD